MGCYNDSSLLVSFPTLGFRYYNNGKFTMWTAGIPTKWAVSSLSMILKWSLYPPRFYSGYDYCGFGGSMDCVPYINNFTIIEIPPLESGSGSGMTHTHYLMVIYWSIISSLALKRLPWISWSIILIYKGAIGIYKYQRPNHRNTLDTSIEIVYACYDRFYNIHCWYLKLGAILLNYIIYIEVTPLE